MRSKENWQFRPLEEMHCFRTVDHPPGDEDGLYRLMEEPSPGGLFHAGADARQFITGLRRTKMAFLVWEPSFSIGVWEIDRQHRLLIGLINQLHEAVSGVDPDKKPQAVFAATVECVRNHFAFEESFFERLGYEDLVAYKGSHKQLLDQLSGLRRQFDAGSVSVSPELVKLLKEWMTTHILQCAHRYAELAAERSQRLMVTSSVADVACMPCA